MLQDMALPLLIIVLAFSCYWLFAYADEWDMARSQGRTGSQWRRVRAQVIASATHCGICGKPLVPDAKWPHPLSTSVDHIIPLVCGGQPLDINNLRATHLKCNMKRGKGHRPKKSKPLTPNKKPVIDKARRTSENW